MEEEFLDEPTNEIADKSRPIAITIVCILGFLGAAVAIPLVFSQISPNLGSWYPPYLGFSTIVGLITMIGLWKMKKWAVYTYTIFVAINQLVLMSMELWNMSSLFFPAIVVAIAITYLNRMD